VSGTVLDEIKKLLMGQAPAKALRIARDAGVLHVALPELAPMLGFDQGSRYHDLTTDEHTFKALETAAKVDAPLRVRWALLFHDSGKPASAWRGKDGRLHYYAAKRDHITPFGTTHYGVMTEDHEVVGERLWREAAERLNVPRELREDVARLIRNHMVPCNSKIKRTKIARGRIEFGDEFLSDLYLHRMCDLTGKGKANKQHMANVAQAEVVRREMAEHKVPRRIKDLEINGGDAKALGLEGRSIGDALARMLDEVAIDPSAAKMSRDWQLDRLARVMG
jgi:tRNA nucleotidyltransferase (CCA-adding enzyme)